MYHAINRFKLFLPVLALALVLLTTVGTGTGSASAATRDYDLRGSMSTAVPMVFQTYWGNNPHPVKSILIRETGGNVGRCYNFDAFSVPGTGGQWKVVPVTNSILPDTDYNVYSFSKLNCPDGNFYIGSRGIINSNTSSHWTVYAGRPPAPYALK